MFDEQVQYRFGLAGEGQADTIQSYLTNHRGRVLYVGCGIDAMKFQNLSNLSKQLTAIDKNTEILQRAEEKASFFYNVKFQVADARHLPFEPRSFDHILALGLFVHIPPEEISSVFAEFWRVCSLEGYLMVTNATSHSKATYFDAGKQCGFELVADEEGYCPAATTKRRYLLVFAKNS